MHRSGHLPMHARTHTYTGTNIALRFRRDTDRFRAPTRMVLQPRCKSSLHVSAFKRPVKPAGRPVWQLLRTAACLHTTASGIQKVSIRLQVAPWPWPYPWPWPWPWPWLWGTCKAQVCQTIRKFEFYTLWWSLYMLRRTRKDCFAVICALSWMRWQCASIEITW